MGGLFYLLALLSLSTIGDARSLKILSIPTTPGTTQTTVTTTEATVPTTTQSIEPAVEQLVAFTDATQPTNDMVVDILQHNGNETVSLDEFEADDNSTVSKLDTTTVPPGMVRLCQCTEVLACQLEARSEKESEKNRTNCFEQCDEKLAFLGNDTESYVDCFETNRDGVSHAERCLESALGEFCSTSVTPQYIEARVISDDYVKTKFIASKEPKKNRPLLFRTHNLVAGFQEYYHCTKNCSHKRMRDCFKTKSCTVRLPPIASFGEAMNKCAKNNVKVARSLRSTCQCLLHKKNLKHISGTCPVINPFRVKNI